MLFSALPLLLLLEQCTSARADIQPVRRDARQHHPRQLLSALGSGSDDSSPVSNAFTLALTHSNEPSTIDKLRDMVLKGRRKHPNHAAKFTQGVKQADGDEAEFDLDLANAQVSFLAEIGVGSGTYNLIVDTGSSNTWIGAERPYQPSGEAQERSEAGQAVSVTYGSGAFAGEEVLETVTIGDLKLQGQGIGIANRTQGFNEGTDGILGVGPRPLTVGTLSPDSEQEIPTVVDTALSQGSITKAELGVYFEPSTDETNPKVGELTIGGYDEGRVTGQLMTTPLTQTTPASNYWGIDMTLSAGDQELLSNNAGIVDTGTTLIYLATDAFQAYTQLIGAEPDYRSGLISFPATQEALDKVPDLSFNFPGINETVVLNKYAQLVPKDLYSVFSLDESNYYGWITDMGSQSGSGLDFILGQKFLERYYSVYSTDDRSLSFAETEFTFPNSL